MLYWAIGATITAIILLALLVGCASSEKEYRNLYEHELYRNAAVDREVHRRGFEEGYREGQDSMAWRYVGLEESYNSAKLRANNWQDECLRLRQAIDELWGVGEG